MMIIHTSYTEFFKYQFLAWQKSKCVQLVAQTPANIPPVYIHTLFNLE